MSAAVPFRHYAYPLPVWTLAAPTPYGYFTIPTPNGHQQVVLPPYQFNYQPAAYAPFAAYPTYWQGDFQRRAAEAQFQRQEAEKNAEFVRREEMKRAEHQLRLAEIEAATRALRAGGQPRRRSVSPQQDRVVRNHVPRVRDPLLYYREDHEGGDDGGVRLFHRPEMQRREARGVKIEGDDEGKKELRGKAHEIAPAPVCRPAQKPKRKRAAFEEGGRENARVSQLKTKKIKSEVDAEDDGKLFATVKTEDDPFI